MSKFVVGMGVYRGRGIEYEGLDGSVAVSLAIGRAALGQAAFIRINNGMIDRVRAEIVGAFLSDPSNTHLLFWDDDIALPTESVRALAKASAEWPIVAVPYPRRGSDPNDFPLEGYDHQTETAESCGMGAMMIRREVFESVRDQHLELTYRGSFDGRPVCAMFAPMVKDNHYYSEDCAFLHRVGLRVKLLVDQEAIHAGLRGKLKDRT